MRTYTPVWLAAQMALGVILGITTWPSMNPYLPRKNRKLLTGMAKIQFIISHQMTFNATQHFIYSPLGKLGVSITEFHKIQK